jgi:23S rRNA U2552 (ribose-2'-O)-methylase RlmE/FtsJ
MDLPKTNQIVVRISRPNVTLNANDLVLEYTSNVPQINDELETNSVLETQKLKLDHINKNIWLHISFLANPFEYIHPKITKFTKHERVVSGRKPISRAYYKMAEILNVFPIFETHMNHTNFTYREPYKNTNMERSFVTAHLAEGPGGFIQAVMDRRSDKKYNTDDVYHGITLDCNNKNKRFVRPDSRINIHYGNITHPSVIAEFALTFASKKAYLVTADGGLNNVKKESVQEQLHTHLVFSEIVNAVGIQAIGGCFVCKIYDINTNVTADMIHLLSFWYSDVYLFKPESSRPINAEKYIVCLGFNGISTSMYARLMLLKQRWSDVDANGDMNVATMTKYVSSICSCTFENQSIRDFNFLYSQQQQRFIEFSLHSMVYLTNDTFLYKIQNEQLVRSVDWCTRNGVNVSSKYASQWSASRSDKLFSNHVIRNTSLDTTTTLYNAIIDYNGSMIEMLTNNFDYFNVPVFVYAYKTKRFLLVSKLWSPRLQFHHLLQYCNSSEILDICLILGYDKTNYMINGMTRIVYNYLNRLDNQLLKEFVQKRHAYSLNNFMFRTPTENLKILVNNERFELLKCIVWRPALSINIVKYAMFYKNSISFIKKLHALVPKYIFTEFDLVNSIKYGHIDLMNYILSFKTKIHTNVNLLTYCLKYEYPMNVVSSVLCACKCKQRLNIPQIIKLPKRDLIQLFEILTSHRYTIPVHKIQEFESFRLPPDVTLLLYKYGVFKWCDRDHIYFKNRLSEHQINQIKQTNQPCTKSAHNPYDCLM